MRLSSEERWGRRVLQKSETGEEKRPYRLGLDLGTNSLGWFVVWLQWNVELKRYEPCALGPGGVRIFSDGRDPKSGASNAADRRDARSARKRRDRFLMRQKTLMSALIRHGLMPIDIADRKNLESVDPYELRAKALDEPLPLHHIGRAIFHINQRRGFQSNRKTDKEDNEKGVMKQAIHRLDEMLEQTKSRTLGEFLWNRHRRREGVRARNISTGAKAAYDFYPTRAHFRREFDLIWDAQASNHRSTMTDAARKAITNAIFDQRDLKEVPVGKCTLSPARASIQDDPGGYRVAWAHPLAQRFRILSEVRNLEISETGKPNTPLTKEQGDLVVRELLANNKVSFDQIRKRLKLPEEARFNFERERRSDLKGDQVAERLAHKNLFHKVWRGYPLDKQIRIAERLIGEAGEDELVNWLMQECEIDRDLAQRVADANLPPKYSRLGLRAINMMMEHVQAGMRYADAAKAAKLDHSRRPTGEQFDLLPYYGEWLQDAVVGSGDPKDSEEKRYGKFPNPTVHIGLGQLRRLTNKLIVQFGAPTQIVIELARDLKISQEMRKEIEGIQAQNQKNNEKRKEALKGVPLVDKDGKHGAITNPSAADLLKMRLWEELGPFHHCPFSGKPIPLHKLFTPEIDIEHLIPYADSLDNRIANKTICYAAWNRLKGNKTPHEAYSSLQEWSEILARANALPPNKRWRFASDARERINRDGRDFLDRQLHETSWLARLAKQYVGAVCDPNEVWVVTGQHTGLIRDKWGLNTLLADHNYTNAKNRADHRHHALDACIIAMTDRSLLQRITKDYNRDRHKIVVEVPWDGFRTHLQEALARITVSHRRDHGVQGKLHDETAYGFVENSSRSDENNLVYRKPLVGLTSNEIDSIRDERLRHLVRSFVDEKLAEGLKLDDALKAFNTSVKDAQFKHGLRRVRILKSKNPKYLLELRQPGENAPYKAYAADSNLYMEIFEKPDGSWSGEAVTVHQANQGDITVRWPLEHPGSKLLMRVYKDDLVRIEYEGALQTARVVRLEPSQKRIRLAPHNEAGSLEDRHKNPNDPYRWIFGQYDRLKDWKARPIRVDELGRTKVIKPTARTTTP